MGSHELKRVDWEASREHLEGAFRQWMKPIADMSRGRNSVESMLVSLELDQTQLWLMLDRGEMVGMVLSELSTYPTGKKICTIIAISGEPGRMSPGRELKDEVEAFAIENGCEAMVCLGSNWDWNRSFPEYVERFRVYEKELDHGRRI